MIQRRSLSLLLVAALACCGGRSRRVGHWDAGQRDGTQPRRDLRIDGPQPRDWQLPPLDHPVPTDMDGPCSKSIGTPCKTDSSCCGGLSCTWLSSGASVCTRKCKPDDPKTPLINEDDCKEPSLVCGDAMPPMGAHVCLRTCKPTLGGNSCPAGLACDPASTAHSSYSLEAVCAAPMCKTGEDCAVRTSETCDVADAAACAAFPSNVFCAPLEPGGSNGHCSFQGRCDQASGLCDAHALGKQSARVGDPCADDRDCAGNMRCEQESSSGSSIHARNGYCVIDGCLFGSTLLHRDCPPGATCQALFSGGRCFRSCVLTDAASCRGVASDVYGDYECLAWDNMAIGNTGQRIADTPTCEPADQYPCSFFAGGALDCTMLGGLDENPTEMACRDRATAAKLPKYSGNGFCLDQTGSGPMP